MKHIYCDPSLETPQIKSQGMILVENDSEK